jgi:hypothetical protein
MMRTQYWLVLVALSLGASSSSAGLISIVNAGFETVSTPLAAGQFTSGMSPSATSTSGLPFIVGTTPAVAVTIPGWVEDTTQDLGSGVYRPDTGLKGFGGQNVAYISNDNFYQTLNSVTLQAGTYILSAKVGLPSTADSAVNVLDTQFNLLAGTGPNTILLNPTSITDPVPVAGQFADWTATFVVAQGDAGVGETLGIQFSNFDQPTGQFGVFLDDVSLSTVPEPGTWTLTLMGMGLVGVRAMTRRRRQPAA